MTIRCIKPKESVMQAYVLAHTKSEDRSEGVKDTYYTYQLEQRLECIEKLLQEAIDNWGSDG